MTADPGAEQDARSTQEYAKRVLMKHRLRHFKPPYAACGCTGWHLRVSEELGLTVQRDTLLDGFNSHRKFMIEERKRFVKHRAPRVPRA